MTIIAEYKDMTEMWQDLMHCALWGEGFEDFRITNESIVSSDNLIRAESCEFDLDLASVGCTTSRWVKFLRDYFPEESLSQWLDQTRKRVCGSEIGLFCRNPGHRGGPCVLGISYRATPHPRLVLFTRTAILPMPGILELAFCSVIGQRLGNPSFTWLAANIQWRNVRLFPYLVYHDLLESFMNQDSFLARQVRIWWEGGLSGRWNYAGLRRAIQAALIVKQLPSLLVQTLKIGEGI